MGFSHEEHDLNKEKVNAEYGICGLCSKVFEKDEENVEGVCMKCVAQCRAGNNGN